MPAQAIHYFMLSPYSVVMDVKMRFLSSYGDATLISMIVLLIAAGLFIRHARCRYSSTYGADGHGFAIIAV